MSIEGLPTPYHAPNATPHVERFHRTLRQDALNHFIFLNGRQLDTVARRCRSIFRGVRDSIIDTNVEPLDHTADGIFGRDSPLRPIALALTARRRR